MWDATGWQTAIAYPHMQQEHVTEFNNSYLLCSIINTLDWMTAMQWGYTLNPLEN